jgi:drug/metabolite transporter (DMT)-like permease
MTPAVALLFAIGCSLCNGISTVQQKIGADHEARVRSLDFTFLLRLLKNKPYAFGIFLAILGYGLSLVALRVLPLFLVQALIAASIVVTAFGEQVFLHRKLDKQTYWSLTAVIIGLALLGFSAVAGHATVNNQAARLAIEVFPFPLALIGLFFVYTPSMRGTAIVLAALGGLAYGNTSTIGRIITYTGPLWKLVENPLIWSLVGSALLGQYFFTIALQRATATKSNAIMIAMQTLGPAACGLFFFGDKIRAGFQLVVLLGSILVIVGSATTAIDESPEATI